MHFCGLEAGRPCQFRAALPDVFQLEHTIAAGLCLDDHAVNQIAFAQIQTVHLQLIVTIFTVGFESRRDVGQVNFRFCGNGCGQGAVCEQLFVCCRNNGLIFVRGEACKQAAQYAGSLAVLCVSSQLVIQALFDCHFYTGNAQNFAAAIFISFGRVRGVCKHAVPLFSCCRGHCIISALCTHAGIASQICIIGNLAVSGICLVAQFTVIVICIREIHSSVNILFRFVVHCECEVLITGRINGNVPSAVAVSTLWQLAAVALGQTQLNAHGLVHPVVCGKLGAVGSQNGVTVAVVIPADCVHMSTQIAVISVDVHADKVAVAGIVLDFADFYRVLVYHFSLRCFRGGTLGELECAVLLLFCHLDAGSVGIYLNFFVDIDQIFFGIAALDFCPVFIDRIGFLEVLIICCRNSNRNIFRSHDYRVVVCTSRFSVYHNGCGTSISVADHVDRFVLSLAGIVVAVSVGVKYLYGALIAAAVQTVVAGGTGDCIICTQVGFSMGIGISRRSFPVAVCGTVQINALILPILCPSQRCGTVHIICGACFFGIRRDRRSDLCSCQYSGRRCTDKLFPVDLSHSNLLNFSSVLHCDEQHKYCVWQHCKKRCMVLLYSKSCNLAGYTIQ